MTKLYGIVTPIKLELYGDFVSDIKSFEMSKMNLVGSGLRLVLFDFQQKNSTKELKIDWLLKTSYGFLVKVRDSARYYMLDNPLAPSPAIEVSFDEAVDFLRQSRQILDCYNGPWYIDGMGLEQRTALRRFLDHVDRGASAIDLRAWRRKYPILIIVSNHRGELKDPIELRVSQLSNISDYAIAHQDTVMLYCPCVEIIDGEMGRVALDPRRCYGNR